MTDITNYKKELGGFVASRFLSLADLPGLPLQYWNYVQIYHGYGKPIPKDDV